MQGEKPAYYSLQQARETKLRKHSYTFPICGGKPDFCGGYQGGEKRIHRQDRPLIRWEGYSQTISLRTHWLEKNTDFLEEKEKNDRYALLHWQE